LVDENTNVETVEQPQATEPEPEPVVDSKPAVDFEAVNTIKQQMSGYEKQIAQQNEKLKELDRIKKAIVGDDLTTGMNEKEKERFFQDLAENPTETIKRVQRESVSSELQEIRNWQKQQDLNRANTQTRAYLSQSDPDFTNVENNMAKYLRPEEFEMYKDSPDGYEILYSKAKTRMEIENKQKAQQTQTATNTAKNIANQTANSEIPVSSGGREEVVVDDLDRNIQTARSEGRWNKGNELTDLDADIFAKYHRDVYGIKPKR